MPITNYFWDPLQDNVTKEYDDNGDTIVRYTTEPEVYGNLISQERDGAPGFYHFDGQGSTLALTDGNGDVTDEYAYNTFGETTEEDGLTENMRQYIGETGYQSDKESKAYYTRARTYQPAVSRWLSRDPIETGFSIFSARTYVYAENNPANAVDPSGMLPIVGAVGLCFLEFGTRGFESPGPQRRWVPAPDFRPDVQFSVRATYAIVAGFQPTHGPPECGEIMMGIEVSPFKSGDRCNAGASHWIDAHQANILPSDRKLVAQPGPGSPTVIDSSWAYHSASSARGGCASLVADVRCQIPCSQDGECCAEFECDVVLDWRIGPLSIYKPYFMRAAYFVPEPEDQTQPCFCTIPECEVKIVDQRVFDLFATFPARETSC